MAHVDMLTDVTLSQLADPVSTFSNGLRLRILGVGPSRSDKPLRVTVRDLDGAMQSKTSRTDADIYWFEIEFNQRVVALGRNSPFIEVFDDARGGELACVLECPWGEMKTSVQAFESLGQSYPERFYDFHSPNYEWFRGASSTVDSMGIAFGVQNRHIDPFNKRDPDWRIYLDNGEFLEREFPQQYTALDPTPLNAVYGRGIEPHLRAQKTPFWTKYRHGWIQRLHGKYYVMSPEEYAALGGPALAKRCGGSGAYKEAGIFYRPGEDDKMVPTVQTRSGTEWEDYALAAFLAHPNNAHIKVQEVGWRDAVSQPEGYPRPMGESLDGLISNPRMTMDAVYQGRKDKWVEAGWDLDEIAKTIHLGALEIKTTLGYRKKKRVRDGESEWDESDGADMSGYYMMQLTHNMQRHDPPLMWGLLVKLNERTGEMLSFMVYRDPVRETSLEECMLHTHKMLRTPVREGVKVMHTFAQAIATPIHKACRGKFFASARWYNEHLDMCAESIEYKKCQAVERLRRYREANSGIPPGRKRATEFRDEDAEGQAVDFVAIDEDHDTVDMESVVKAHQDVLRLTKVGQDRNALKDALVRNIHALSKVLSKTTE